MGWFRKYEVNAGRCLEKKKMKHDRGVKKSARLLWKRPCTRLNHQPWQTVTLQTSSDAKTAGYSCEQRACTQTCSNAQGRCRHAVHVCSTHYSVPLEFTCLSFFLTIQAESNYSFAFIKLVLDVGCSRKKPLKAAFDAFKCIVPP